MKFFLLILFLITSTFAQAQGFSKQEIAKWRAQAKRITIIRDQWGIAHVYGRTDADAVFGMLYAQCEDDFPRVEQNYITATGRLAEVEGEASLYLDMRNRLFSDTAEAIMLYKNAEPWLRKLCDGFADGINFYLHSHPEVKPKLLKRFHPWMPFLFSEGSIGGDITRIPINRLKEFYAIHEKQEGPLPDNRNEPEPTPNPEPEPQGSNGFAIAPSRSASGNALLLINPHTSFYFRPEIHVNSEEGLNVYGAVTWGQFFIYQGFNEYCGWMHTTSEADRMDLYEETIVMRGDSIRYAYGSETRPMRLKKIKLAYRDGDQLKHKTFVTYATHHGPVVGKQNERWISVRMMNEPVKALTQSFKRTKSKGFDDYKQTMQLKTNSSNNTVYADNKGNIAYWHGNFIPRRDPGFNWRGMVDGSNPATEWKGLHEVDEMIHVYNPASGWIQNCNATPFTVSGKSSPDRNAFPDYMAPDAENARGIHAVRVLQNDQRFTLESLIDAAYDSYLPGFEELIPSLVAAMEVEESKLEEQKLLLQKWDKRFGIESVPTALSIFWGQELRKMLLARLPSGLDQLTVIQKMISETTTAEKVAALEKVIAELERDFGTWKVGWGEVNRFQRLSGNIQDEFDDAKPSLPVAFTSSYWGSLAAFGSQKYPGTKKMYGNVGNSFVAVVEFGSRVKAKSVLAGGVSNDPKSPYFNNQSAYYSQVKFKDVSFYKEDVVKNASKTYQPGH